MIYKPFYTLGELQNYLSGAGYVDFDFKTTPNKKYRNDEKAVLPARQRLKPLLQIHDELTFELPENGIKNAVIFIKKCVETNPFEEFSVPIITEVSIGQRFGEMREVEFNAEENQIITDDFCVAEVSV